MPPKSKAKAKAKAVANAPQMTTAQKIIALFQSFDANKDGVIEEKEMAKLFEKLEPKFTKDQITELLKSADANKDGVIDYQEFMAWLFGEGEAAGPDLLSKAGASMTQKSLKFVQQLHKAIQVKPYGVLGSQMLESGDIVERGPEPGKHKNKATKVYIVDPAGLPFIQETGPSGAGGASGQIYSWLGIGEDDAFPQEIRDAIKEPLTAKHHNYGPFKDVIHVVGPNFCDSPCSREQAVAQLAQAYYAVLSEFMEVEGWMTYALLRILPVSGGIFAGEFLEFMPEMTAEALKNGFALLKPELQKYFLDQKDLELCIFAEKDLKAFTEAITDGSKK